MLTSCACRDPVLAAATRKRRLDLRSTERPTSQKDRLHSGIKQEPLLAAFQGSDEGCYCRLEVAHSFLFKARTAADAYMSRFITAAILSADGSSRRVLLSESTGTLFRGNGKHRIQRRAAQAETAAALRMPDMVKLEILLHVYANNHVVVRDIQSVDNPGTVDIN